MATTGQTFAIFCLAKFDVRNSNLTKEKASSLIDQLKNGHAQSALAEIAALPNAVKKGEPAKPKQDWQALYDKAHLAGMEAAQACVPVPMVVEGRANPLDDSSPVTKRYFVSEGACGFGWISIKPANCTFANWLKKNNLAKTDSYSGGVMIWVHQFNQSYDRKMIYATAFAQVISQSGIRAYAGGRLD